MANFDSLRVRLCRQARGIERDRGEPCTVELKCARTDPGRLLRSSPDPGPSTRLRTLFAVQNLVQRQIESEPLQESDRIQQVALSGRIRPDEQSQGCKLDLLVREALEVDQTN